MTVKLPEADPTRKTSVVQSGVLNSMSMADLMETPGSVTSVKRRVELHKAISVSEHVRESLLRKALHQLSAFMARVSFRSRLRLHSRYRDSWDVLTLPGSVFKVVVLGAGGVGKTSLVQRFVNGSYSEQYTPTVEDLYEKSVTLNKDFNAFFQITDTSGSYQFPAMKRLTIQNGDAFVLVYSLAEKESLEEALRIRQEILEIKGADKSIPMVLVGNKTDLISEEARGRTRAQLNLLTRQHGLLSSEASAKLDVNVSGVFTALLAQIALANEEHNNGHRTRR